VTVDEGLGMAAATGGEPRSRRLDQGLHGTSAVPSTLMAQDLNRQGRGGVRSCGTSAGHR
jgi:hypothetical protein